jgi:RNA polymerase sigma factor (sigma-70 family)
MSEVMRDYLNAIGQYPLLTTDQEIKLSRRVKRWQELRDKSNPTNTERREIRSGLRAREELVKCNLRLVVHVSRRFAMRIRGAGMDHMDLIQEGTVGLQRAAELFDGTKGYKFSTYAYWWIRQAMNRGLESYDRVVRIPTNALEKVNRAFKIKNEYRQAHGVLPTLDQVAEIMGMKPSDLRMIMERSTMHTSLDVLAKEDGSPLVDMLSNSEDLYDDVNAKERHAEFYFAYNQLDDFDRDIIAKHFGLHGGEPMTLLKIAQQHNVSRERIRQRRDRALVKIRRALGKTATFECQGTLPLLQVQ